jgi:ribonuclease BN (tRNA processing enzyme)
MQNPASGREEMYSPRFVKKAERSKKVMIVGGGPAGLEALIRKFDTANNYKLFRQPFPLEFIEIRPLEKFQFLKDVEAVAIKTPHTAESLALHVRSPNAAFFYTSDTGFDEALAATARNVDLLLIECSFVRDKPVKGHLELAEAMHLVRRASPKRVMLTHLYSEWDSVDFQSEVAKFEPGCDVIEAVDGLSTEL